MRIVQLKEMSEEDIDALMDRESPMFEVMEDVSNILAGVQEGGDAKLFDYTKKFDGADIDSVIVYEEDLADAKDRVDPSIVKQIEKAAANLTKYHTKEKEVIGDFSMDEFAPGVSIGHSVIPMELVGAYVPGGSHAYPSSALMTVIPAKVAGVSHVIMCTPPGPDGKVNDLTLVAADIAGVDQIFKVGGAQAIAAMAFGTDTIPRVEKIVGPGNIYVAAAKTLVEDTVEIDFPAGPSEVMILGDNTAKAPLVASDMIAQLEHGDNSVAILVTSSKKLAEAVQKEVGDEIPDDSKSLILLVKSLAEGISIINFYAPEHIEMMVSNASEVAKEIRNAGSIFIGNFSPVAVGDYASGTNHVLPTAGYARVVSGLSVDHFVKKIPVQMLTKKGLSNIKDCAIDLANAEGMSKHAESISARFSK
ncbi:MAG: histidinol dehydrogenase [Halobacteriota archaeon]|nr:histidinol dehydrogenase [Halobacteriota archaeon]